MSTMKAQIRFRWRSRCRNGGAKLFGEIANFPEGVLRDEAISMGKILVEDLQRAVAKLEAV